MSEPRRFIEHDDAKGRLLRAARADAPSVRSHRRAASAIVAASMTSATVAGAARDVARKWLLGAVLAVTVGGAATLAIHGAAPPSPRPVASVAIEMGFESSPRLEASSPRLEASSPRREGAIAQTPNRAEPPHPSGSPPRRQGGESVNGARGEPGSTPAPKARRASLRDELAALDEAKRLLDGGDPSGALGALDRYALAFPQGHLAPEALVLRISTLERRGDHDGARALYDRFVEANPESPLRDRARAVVGAPR